MPDIQLDRELQREFRVWIEAQKVKGFGAPGLMANSSYVPTPRVAEYFKASKQINQLLKGLGTDQGLEAHQKIIVNYHKVLGILIIIGQGHYIEDFVRHASLCDARLPFEYRPEHFPFAQNGDDFFEKFKEVQWQFCAEPFTYYMDRVYESARVLPIATKDQIGGGASSTIFKIVLPQDYDELEPDGDSEKKNPGFRHAHTYVLKTYRTRDAKSYYTNDIRAFRKVMAASGSKHGLVRGLIGFHGNFIYDDTYNVLLEYADKGTLEDYFMSIPPPTSEDDIVSFWRGLFSPIFALLNIHTLEDQDFDNPSIFQGWHQDIKPENILVISNARPSPYKYEFKLADLGLSHFKRPQSSNGEVTDMGAYGTRTYGAPEFYRCDNYVGPVNLRVSKSVDIWSLGCVYSEAATWLVLGKEGLEQYRADRKAETSKILGFKDSGCFHNGETILKSVERFHTDIVGRERKTDHITRDVLCTIIVDMLGVENLRPTAGQIWPKSQRILEYATKSRQNSNWSSATESPTPSRNPTLNGSPQDTQTGALPGRQTRPTHASGSKRNTRQENGYFMGENNKIEHSPERMSVYAKPQPRGDSSPESKRNSVFSSSAKLSPPNTKNPEIYWSVDDAHLWKDSQRKRKFRTRTAPGGGERYMDMISKRDHVFIVDDSSSMRATEWYTITSRFSLLAYIVKHVASDGLDLYFSSSTKHSHSRRSSELTEIVQKRPSQPLGSDNLVTVLETVFDAFRIVKFGGGNKGFLGRKSAKQKKPTTCYILTDGAWCSEQGGAVVSLINRFVVELVERGGRPNDFGIQFVSFGSHDEGHRFLQSLDDGLHLERDIVDTESANGDVWKMLLGSIDKSFDTDIRARPSIGINRAATAAYRGFIDDNEILDVPESNGPSFSSTSRINMWGSSGYTAPKIDEQRHSNSITPKTSETVASPTMDTSQTQSAQITPVPPIPAVQSSILEEARYSTEHEGQKHLLRVEPMVPETVGSSTMDTTSKTRTTQLGSVFSKPEVQHSVSEPTRYSTEQDGQESSLPRIDREKASSPNIADQHLFEQPSQDSLVKSASDEVPSIPEALEIESMWSLDSVPLTMDQKEDIISAFSKLLYVKIQEDNVSLSLPKLWFHVCHDLFEKQVKNYSETILRSPKSSDLKMTRKASKAIRSFAREISQNFQEIASADLVEEEFEEEPERPEGEDQSFREKCETWDYNPAYTDEVEITEAKVSMDSFQDDEESENDHVVERDLKDEPEANSPLELPAGLDRQALCESLTTHPAFKVLADHVINILRHHGNNVMQVIEKSIAANVSLKKLRTWRVVLRADWDVLEFIEDQYGPSRNVNLGHILTITGNCMDAQMTTTSEYLAQTWPSHNKYESWGPHSLLSTIQEAIFRKKQNHKARQTFDYREHNVIIEVTLAYGRTVVEVAGPGKAILDVSQQLAWLGSACRASSPRCGLSYCDTVWSSDPLTTNQNGAIFHINYRVVPFNENEHGRCWTHLIGNSVVASGFPIPERSEEMKGLQIPLQIMAALGGASSVFDNGKGFVLKGLYMAFIPVKRIANDGTQDQVQWHLLENGDAPISYEKVENSARLQRRDLDERALASTVAFLGWTPEVINCAATDRIVYDEIQWSGESLPHELSVRCGGFHIGISQIGTLNIPFNITKKDIRRDSWTPSNLYDQLCEEASKQCVILYDTKTKQSWLIDAERVVFQIILHGLRTGRFSSIPDEVRAQIHAANPYDTRSVRERMNLFCNMELYQTRDIQKGEIVGRYFADLVKELLDAIAILFERTQRFAKENSEDLVDRVPAFLGRHTVLAYEYMDVLERSTNKTPRRVVLEHTCGDWPELARKLPALILVAKNFQEVLQPNPKSTSKCSSFGSLPADKSYLAVEMSMLHMLSKAEDSQGFLGSSGMHWKASQGLFDPCPAPDGQKCRCHRLQGFSTGSQRTLLDPPQALCRKGAVIFGIEPTQKWGKLYRNRSDSKSLPAGSTTKVDSIPVQSTTDGTATDASGLEATGLIATNESGMNVTSTTPVIIQPQEDITPSANGYSDIERSHPTPQTQPIPTAPSTDSTSNNSRILKGKMRRLFTSSNASRDGGTNDSAHDHSDATLTPLSTSPSNLYPYDDEASSAETPSPEAKRSGFIRRKTSTLKNMSKLRWNLATKHT